MECACVCMWQNLNVCERESYVIRSFRRIFLVKQDKRHCLSFAILHLPPYFCHSHAIFHLIELSIQVHSPNTDNSENPAWLTRFKKHFFLIWNIRDMKIRLDNWRVENKCQIWLKCLPKEHLDRFIINKRIWVCGTWKSTADKKVKVRQCETEWYLRTNISKRNFFLNQSDRFKFHFWKDYDNVQTLISMVQLRFQLAEAKYESAFIRIWLEFAWNGLRNHFISNQIFPWANTNKMRILEIINVFDCFPSPKYIISLSDSRRLSNRSGC